MFALAPYGTGIPCTWTGYGRFGGTWPGAGGWYPPADAVGVGVGSKNYQGAIIKNKIYTQTSVSIKTH